MWPGMIAAFPLNDHAHRFFHPFVKIFAQSLRKFRVVRLRGTLAAYFIIGTIISLLALSWAGRFTREELRLSLLLIPGTVLGYFLSRRAAAYLDAGYTRVAVLAVSVLAAFSVIATVLL